MMPPAPRLAPSRASARAIGAVVVGGALGTSARVLVDAAVPYEAGRLALSTLLVNVIGSLLLGFVVARLWPRLPEWARAGLGAGVLGSFTTFSALAVSVVELGEAGDLLGAVMTVVISLGLGILAALAGLALGRRGDHLTPTELDEVSE